MVRKVKRFEVYLVALDPTIGSEIQKTRPCVVVTPNEMNSGSLFLVAPMMTKLRFLPSNIQTVFNGKDAMVLLGQIRTIDTKRLVKPLGVVDKKTEDKILLVLQKMFQR